MARLSGKVAVITGAASGIGLAAATLFAAEGAAVLAVDRDPEGLERALEGLSGLADGGPVGDAGGAVSPFVADVTHPERVAAAMAAAVERFGGIDVLLPNAGIWGTVAPIDAYPLETFARVVDLNLTAVFSTMQQALPHMVERGGGSIVLTSSCAGVTGVPGAVAYVATKHALIGVMRTAAMEYAPKGIRVNTVNPGPIETPMMRELEAGFNPQDPEAGATFLKSTTLLNRYGTAPEVAELMCWLASDASAYATGGVFMLDGGMHLA